MFIPVSVEKVLNKDAESVWNECLEKFALREKRGFLPNKFIFERASNPIELGTRLSVIWAVGTTVEGAQVTQWEPAIKSFRIQISGYEGWSREYECRIEELGNSRCIRRIGMKIYFHWNLVSILGLVFRASYWWLHLRKISNQEI